MDPFEGEFYEEDETIYINDDVLKLRPLGAGQEVGRSCLYMEFKGKRILFDMGIHPGKHGMNGLPFLDVIEPRKVDILLISHFHLDHCGALPWFLCHTEFKGKVYMTHATKAIYRWLLADCIKVGSSNRERKNQLYTEKDLMKSLNKIEGIDFHEEIEHKGIRFWSYQAGHVLGAAMFMLEIAGIKVLYTGDFSREEDRHLMSAEIPEVKPDILIVESTYGTHIHDKREEREARFTSIIQETVLRGGRVLIPVFALGRAQELLLILDEYWARHPELQKIPIYYASSLAQKCMSIYQTFTHAMNHKIRSQIAVNNPFFFKYISHLKAMHHFEDRGPCVVMASPGMMQSGMSRKFFEMWCGDRKNTCIIAGYCVEGTLAKTILNEPMLIRTMAGKKIPRNCQVYYISFSAHTDYRQTSEFIRILRPPHVVMVHGEANEMLRLKNALVREYEDTPDAPVFHNPKNIEWIELHIRGEKMAKVRGSLGKITPVEGDIISGVLISNNFKFQLVTPEDLYDCASARPLKILQKLKIPYTGTLDALEKILESFNPENDKKHLFFHNQRIRLSLVQSKYVMLHFLSDVELNPIADAIVLALLKKPDASKPMLEREEKQTLFEKSVVSKLSSIYGIPPGDFHMLKSEMGNRILAFLIPNIEELPVPCKVDLLARKVATCSNDAVVELVNNLLKATDEC